MKSGAAVATAAAEGGPGEARAKTWSEPSVACGPNGLNAPDGLYIGDWRDEGCARDMLWPCLF